jgi:Prokaryotic membrane lipoprotein lipid attachment site
MKKFYTFLVAILILTGCQGQKKANTAGTTVGPDTNMFGYAEGDKPKASEPTVKAKAATTVETRTETRVETKVAAKTETAPPPAAPKATPPPAPTPTAPPAPTAQPAQAGPQLIRGVSPGAPPVVMLRGQTRTRTYTEPIVREIHEYTRMVWNASSSDMHVTTTGPIPFLRLTNQCVNKLVQVGSGQWMVDNRVACPFVEKFTQGGSKVILLRAGHRAKFVVPINMCPRKGDCTITLRAVKYSDTTPIARGNHSRPISRSYTFPTSLTIALKLGS